MNLDIHLAKEIYVQKFFIIRTDENLARSPDKTSTNVCSNWTEMKSSVNAKLDSCQIIYEFEVRVYRKLISKYISKKLFGKTFRVQFSVLTVPLSQVEQVIIVEGSLCPLPPFTQETSCTLGKNYYTILKSIKRP